MIYTQEEFESALEDYARVLVAEAVAGNYTTTPQIKATRELVIDAFASQHEHVDELKGAICCQCSTLDCLDCSGFSRFTPWR